MDNFELALKFLFSNETYLGKGGILVTTYHDPETGEFSNYGISQAFLRLIKFRTIIPTELTMIDIREIYKTYFWNHYWLDKVTDSSVAAKCFDMFVNMNPIAACKIIQYCAACPQDGRMGPITIAQINSQNSKSMMKELVQNCINYYTKIATGPNAKNLNSWVARAKKVPIP